MTEPIFDSSTERIYKRGVPGNYRTADRDNAYTLKKWLSGIGSQLNTIDTIIQRFAYTPPQGGVVGDTSDLVDPNTCDYAWLPWLAQLVGVDLDYTLSVPDQRLQVSTVNFLKGTKASMAQAVQTVLTGARHVSIYDHTSSSGAIGAASEWDMLIVTVTSETLSDPIAAVNHFGVKPAGVILHEETFTSTWDAVAARYPTWATWDATTWTGIEESGL